MEIINKKKTSTDKKAQDEKFKFQAEIKVCEENKVSMIQTVS